MPVGALIGGGLSLAGAIGSSVISSNAAKSAASSQADSQQKVLQMLQSTIGPILAQGKDIAGTALGPLKSLLTPGANMTDTLSKMPGFQFAQDWGQKAVANLGTTTGLSGNTLTAGANFATGLAQQGYGTIVNQLQSFLNSGLSTQTNAAGALSGGSQTALTGIGNAQAAGTLGSANAISGGITGGTNAVSNALLTNALFSKLNIGGGGGSSGIYSTQTAPGMGFGYPTV